MSKLSIPVSPADHTQGNSSAARILVEYGDYECPSCGEVQAVIRKLQKHFGQRLLFVFRNFPLNEIHPWAEAAAETAEFAAEHGKFWEMHNLLYENQEQMSNELFLACAGKLNLPRAQLQAALARRSYRDRIQSDFEGGVRSGVNGTPTFFINEERYDGSFDFASLRDAVEQAA